MSEKEKLKLYPKEKLIDIIEKLSIEYAIKNQQYEYLRHNQKDDLQTRINKAIEYIKRELLQELVEYYKNNKYDVTISGTDIMAYEIVDLLDILKGSDSNE